MLDCGIPELRSPEDIKWLEVKLAPASSEEEAAELMLKDLGLALAAAEDTGADTPMGQMAAELYRLFVEEEGGRGMDFSAMIKRFERQ